MESVQIELCSQGAQILGLAANQWVGCGAQARSCTETTYY
jgi:hypothetical protein